MRFRAALIFITSALLLFLSLFYRASGAIIAPLLSSDLHLTPQDLGFLGGAFFYSFAIMQLPLGFLMDRIGARWTMVGMNFLAVIGAVIFASSGSLLFAVVGRALLGFGMAGNLMGPIKIFLKWFSPAKLATLSGVLLSVASLGCLASTSPLALLVEVLGWRGSFYALAGVNLLLIFSIILFVRDRPGELQENARVERRDSAWWPSIKMLFSSWSYWAISVSVFCRYGAFASIQTLWAGPFLIKFLRLDPVAAGNILLLLNLGYSFGASSGGYVSDRILRSRKRTIYLAYVIAACATLVLAEYHGSGSLLLVGITFFIIGFVNAFNQISFIHIQELMPERISGSAMTATNFFGMMGAGAFVHGLGLIFEQTPQSMLSGSSYQQAFLVCFGAFIVSLLCYLPVKESKAMDRR